jgi:hypothetical protein
MRVSIDSLVTLAGKDGSDSDLQKYEKLPQNIRDALKEEMEENRRNASKQVAKQLVEILNFAEDKKKRNVQRIRALRAEERKLKQELDTIDQAQELAESEANFIPLCNTLGLIHGSELRRLIHEHPDVLEIPEKKVDKKEKKK